MDSVPPAVGLEQASAPMRRHLDDDGVVVCMLCPGGTEHSGGIGRWAGYVRDAWQDEALHPRLEIVDTRGVGGWIAAAVAFTGALVRLGRLRAAGKLGLIHANLSVRGSSVRKCIIGVFAAMTGVKLVVHLHSGRFFEFYRGLPFPARLALRLLFASAAHVIVLGRVWEEQVVTVLGVPRTKITLLYSGVRMPVRLAAREAADGVCHIVMLGRLGPPKGVPELLEALADDRLRGRRWRATLAGDGDIEGALSSAARLGIGERVQCPGWLDAEAVSVLLQGADILVLPSHSENLPVSVIEALAHRVAVVTTPVGATPELVTDGVSAILIPPRDPGALSAALIRLIDDPHERARIAENGHEVFTSRLDVAVMAPRLASLYARLLMSRAGVGATHGV